MTSALNLILGASGYVGGRLAPLLLERGHPVRAAARSQAKLAARPFASHPLAQTAQVDILDYPSVLEAMRGVEVVFYLVHSMASAGSGFAGQDRQGAENVARAAQEAGVKRIIYLGGLTHDHPELSRHLRSRHETGQALASTGVPLTWLKAAMILGAGSASFEIMRYLVERLPVMITPRWVGTLSQPIAISNVLGYLAGCLENPATTGLTLDIGGPDVLSYRDIFRLYAQEAGLPRPWIIPVPVFSPTLSSYWIHLITPVPHYLARPLAEGLKNEAVCQDRRILDLVPQELLTCRQAIRVALDRVGQMSRESCWSDAGQIQPPEWLTQADAGHAGGDVLECGLRAVAAGVSQEDLWAVVRRLGGQTGWYYAQGLWWLRGALDRMLGGVGLGRGRRDPDDPRVGDALDFWRVLAVEEGKRLLLLAQLKLPGQGVFQVRLQPGPQGVEMFLTMRFLPRGLGGLAYWRLCRPLHALILKGMAKNMARAAGGYLAGPTRPYHDGGRACALN